MALMGNDDVSPKLCLRLLGDDNEFHARLGYKFHPRWWTSSSLSGCSSLGFSEESVLVPCLITFMASSQASLFLQKQLKELNKHPVDGFSAGLVDDNNVFEWALTIMGPPDTLYDGGYFNAIMSFPEDYPNGLPSIRFTSEMWHPNVYPDGRVCISILDPPVDDPLDCELEIERWTALHTVESIGLSIISMLSSPNDESPTNVEAAKEWREDRDEFKKKVSHIVRRSQEKLSGSAIKLMQPCRD